MIRVSVSVASFGAAIKLIDRIEDKLRESDVQEQVANGALRRMATFFDRNFASGGTMVGGWKALSESTVKDRERLGLPGPAPILVRYSDLRDYTATFLQNVGASATFSTTDPQGGDLRVTVQSSRGAVNVVASGAKALHQVSSGHSDPENARPYWFVNSDILRAARQGGAIEIAKTIKRL